MKGIKEQIAPIQAMVKDQMSGKEEKVYSLHSYSTS
jgi:hypothetical protein